MEAVLAVRDAPIDRRAFVETARAQELDVTPPKANRGELTLVARFAGNRLGENPGSPPIQGSNRLPEDRTMARVPDVLGLPVRTAARRLHEAGLRVEWDGSGVVRTMAPEAGSIVSPGDTVRVADNADMQAISAAVGIDVQTVAGFTRAGGEPFGSNQAAIDAIYDELVLTGGQVSEIIELDASRAAIFKVTTYYEATRQPLNEVHDQVAAELTTQQAELILVALAEQLLTAVATGEDFAQAAAANGFSAAESKTLTRGDQALDQVLLFDIFSAGKPTAEAPVLGRVQTLDGAYAVYSLDAVLPGRPEAIPLAERDQGKLVLAQQSGYGDFQAFVKSLYDNADITVNDDLLAANNLFQ